jgi:hypothetical protein
MRGEFIGVWSETWRELWLPLIDEPLGGGDEVVADDIFCELYRELVKALRTPKDSAAVALLLRDAIALREVFEGAAHQANLDLTHEAVREAYDQSAIEAGVTVEQRRARLEVSLSDLLQQPVAPLVDAQLQEQARDAAKVKAAWMRAAEKTFNDTETSRESFKNLGSADIAGERALVGFVESVHGILEDFERSNGDELSNRYFNLLERFIGKFSLRYDLRRPCTLCPTLPGVFASLVRDLRVLTSQDPHLDTLMKEFENAVRDLRHDCSDGRIKTCIQKQVNLLEAIGRTAPGVTGTTLGAICNQLGTWPHEKLKTAMKDLYHFASDYPGIRHGGTPASALRAVDMRDMVAMSILLTGFTPYLESRLSAAAIFGGSADHAGPVAPGPALAVGSVGAPIAVARPGGFLSWLASFRRRER